MSGGWTANELPDLSGSVALVTGATSGIGREVAQQLASHGATVFATSRRGPHEAPKHPSIAPIDLDVADMDSVRRAAAHVAAQVDRLDILVHCAGIMATPLRKTGDDFELVLATNYLGPVLLTHELLPLLDRAERSRVVMVGSPEAMLAKMNLDDLNLERGYSWADAYRQSKLANVMFALELNDRAVAAGSDIVALAAHPGFTRTKIITSGMKEAGSRWRLPMLRLMSKLLGQPVEMGALPILYAAAADGATGGSYHGPDGRAGLRGYPTEIEVPALASDADLRDRLWDATESMLGIDFDLAAKGTRQGPRG